MEDNRRNTKYGKLDENGRIEYAPYCLKTDEGWIVTSDPQPYIEAGYKPIRRDPYPSDGGYYIRKTTESNAEIIEGWEAAEPPQTEEDKLMKRLGTIEEQLKAVQDQQTDAELALVEMYESGLLGKEI